MGVNLPTQGLWHFAVECLQVCIARPILSVKEHMYSRLLPAPILAPAGAGPPWQRPLCDPDPQARRLQARRGSGSGDGPVARQPRPGCAPTQQCVWPAALMITCAQAQLIMLLAALHQTSDTFLHSPHDALVAYALRTGLLRCGRGCCAADGAAARRTGLLRGDRGCCAATGAAALRPGLLLSERGCCATDWVAARQTGLSFAADGAAARRTGLLRGGRGCCAADGFAARRTGLLLC
jgi:hypothetical protein